MRYILFMFDTYYPCGGWNDYAGSFDTIEEARNAYHVGSYDNYQILDTHYAAEDMLVED